MSVRLYLTNQTVGYTPTTKRGAWDVSSGTTIKKLGLARGGTAATVGIAETNATVDYDVFLGRWVSDAIVNGKAISGALTTMIGALESNAAADMYLHVHAYVTTGDSDTPRGTLLADGIGATEWPTTAAGTTETFTMSSVTASAGDRIVVEIGYRAKNTVTTSYTGTINYGGTNANNLTAGGTATLPGYVDIATEGLFANETHTLTDALDNSSIDTGKWATWFDTSVTVVETSALTVTLPTAGGYGGMESTSSYSLYGSTMFSKLNTLPGGSMPTNIEIQPIEFLASANYKLSWAITVDTINAYKTVAGTSTQVGSSVTLNQTTMKYFAIREDAGTVYWDYSADGLTWTNLTSLANPFPLDYGVFSFGGGAWSALGSTYAFSLNNVNIAPNSQTQTGKARIALTTSQTQTGKMTIAGASSKYQTGKTRIEIASTKTQTGKANIVVTVTTTKTQTGKAKITGVTARTQTGKARVSLVTTKTQTGKANILAVSSTQRTQLGKMRITKSASQTITGKAKVTATTTRTITGKANIPAAGTRTQTGKARVTATTLKPIYGKGSIAKSVTKTTTGKARVSLITSKTITGKASIPGYHQRTQAGVMRVASPPIFLGKKHEFKVYSKAGSYIETWSDVISDFVYSQEINTAGSGVEVTLALPADNYGEGQSVNFMNKVEVYVYDQDTPSGLLMFTGFISGYKPIFGTDERVVVTVMGYGMELDEYVIESGESVHITQATDATTIPFSNTIATTGTYGVAQVFRAASTTKASRFITKLKLDNIAIYDSATVNFKLYSGATPGAGSLLSTTKAYVTSDTASEVNFVLPLPISITSGSDYWFEMYTATADTGSVFPVSAAATTSTAYANGSVWTKPASGGSYAADTNKDLYFKVYQSTGSTTATYSSQDPSDILKSLIDDYRSRGGTINYDGSSITATGTTVSYTFNTNTTLEGVKKVLELCPVDWYWYIDQATNLIHLHEKTGTADHRLLVDKHLSRISIEKRIEDVVNVVYFTGGETSPGVNMYRKYVRESSVVDYGFRSLKVQDTRVTVTGTADTIANSILDTRSGLELRIEASIIDSSVDRTRGYDIESVRIGDEVVFGGEGFGGTGSSLWDVLLWDVDVWDFSYTDITTLILQVTKLAYNGDSVSLSLSTVPPDVNKRIEDINRNLDAQQTTNNPSTPS